MPMYKAALLTDEMTGLPNRVGAIHIISSLLKNHPQIAIYFFDINHQKDINHYLGREPVGCGTIATVCAVQRIKASSRNAIVSRLSGDEGIVITTNPLISIEDEAYYKELDLPWVDYETATIMGEKVREYASGIPYNFSPEVFDNAKREDINIFNTIFPPTVSVAGFTVSISELLENSVNELGNILWAKVSRADEEASKSKKINYSSYSEAIKDKLLRKLS